MPRRIHPFVARAPHCRKSPFRGRRPYKPGDRAGTGAIWPNPHANAVARNTRLWPIPWQGERIRSAPRPCRRQMMTQLVTLRRAPQKRTGIRHGLVQLGDTATLAGPHLRPETNFQKFLACIRRDRYRNDTPYNRTSRHPLHRIRSGEAPRKDKTIAADKPKTPRPDTAGTDTRPRTDPEQKRQT